MPFFSCNLDRGTASYWRGWVCLLLALLMLYNPFAASLGSDGALNVCHRASNRATVGASELQHFCFANGRDRLLTHDSALVKALAPSSELSAHSLPDLPQETSLPQQIFGASLWFRPPPAL
jgi:hypothetical protein